MGGSDATVPVHATVMMFGAPLPSAQATITTGTGFSMVEGFHWSFFILFTVEFSPSWTSRG